MAHVISEKTALMARRLITSVVIPHAGRVYAALGEGGNGLELTQSVAGYLLTKQPNRIVVSDLTTAIRACRNKTVAEIGDLISPLVAGGWLDPENDYPTNRAWKVNPEIYQKFKERTENEIKRRALVRRAIFGELRDGPENEAGL
jgi:hypothetical protein